MSAEPLRQCLSGLSVERRALEADLRDVRRRTGKALLKVADSDELTLTEAAAILDLSRPTLYCLLEDARAA